MDSLVVAFHFGHFLNLLETGLWKENVEGGRSLFRLFLFSPDQC